jgi:uncharacterized glyoxalase superfamily protein PhnB
VVNDYDEAIGFYVRKLSFILLEDTRLSDTKRWVVIAPPGSTGCTLLLAKADNDAQKAAVGNQTGGRVLLILHTEDFDRDYNQMQEAGIEFMESPRHEAYGKVVVFADLYGNKWDLIEPK